MKKIITVVLIVVSILSVFTIGAFAAEAIRPDYIRPEADDLDDKTIYSALDGVSVNYGVNAGYVRSEGHGMVLSATFHAVNGHLSFNKISEAIATKDDASGIELSFDIKIDTPNNDGYASICTSFYQGSARLRIYWFNNHGKLAFRNAHGWAWTTTDIDFPEDGWFHIRTVIYRNSNTKRCYYINGSDTPFVQDLGAEWDITKITNFDFYIESTQDEPPLPSNSAELGTNIQLDNIFFGYIGATEDSITSVWTGIMEWVTETLGSVTGLFWDETNGLTLIGTLSVIGISVGIVFLIIGVIQNFLHLRG